MGSPDPSLSQAEPDGAGVGNTPVQIPPSGASTRIDWLGYTLPDHTGQPPALESMTTPWQHAGKGRYGYQDMYKWKGAELWVGHHNAGPHIDLSGKACRDLETTALAANPAWTWAEHLSWLIEIGARFSRLDFALDVVDSDLDVATIHAAMEEEQVTSRWDHKTWNVIKGVGKRHDKGYTLYLGSGKSDSQLCIYDKRAEQHLPATSPRWIRIEFRPRHEAANAMARRIVEQGMAGGLAALRSYFDLTEEAEGCALWREVLDNASKAPLRVIKRGGTVEGMMAYLEDTMGPTLATARALLGNDADYLNLVADAALPRLKAKHKSMIRQAEQQTIIWREDEE